MEGKTYYLARQNFLKSNLPRLVVRKSNRYIMAQIIKSQNAQDFIESACFSKELGKYGLKSYSLKNLGCAYLCGLILAKKTKEKKAILDIGLLRSTKFSKIYAVAKGCIDAGMSINVSKEMLPDDQTLAKKLKNVQEIKEKILSSELKPKKEENKKKLKK